MNSNLEKFKKDIVALVSDGEELLKSISEDNSIEVFQNGYETWYSESLSVIDVILNKRKSDFELYYNSKDDCIRKIINSNFDMFNFNEENIINNAITLFNNQLNILKASQKKFTSSLFDIQQIVQADLFDNELDTAIELNKKGFVRGAGAIAGVVLESHLQQVCKNHEIKIKKKNPTINDLNELLKKEEVIEVKDLQFIIYLGGLRNSCDHKKEKEPSKDDISELIKGVSKISKTIY